MNKPKIRFKGFEGEWKEIKLGEIFSVEIGEFVIKTKQKNNAPYPVYNGGVSNTGFYDCYNQEGPKIIVSARGANAGYVNYCTTDFWAGNSCYSIGAKNNDELKFFFYFLKRFQEIYMKNQYSASIPSISKQQILRTNLMYPSLPEQRALASYFTSLDAQIAASASRLSSLKQIKAASLLNMFPQKGETVPRVRFKGFQGEWKEVKLSSIAIFSKGQGYSKSDLRENGHPIILYGRMYTKYQFAINEVDTFSNLKGAYVLSEGNEIIMPASGETPEDIACASAVLAKGIILGGDLNIVRFDLKKYSTPFLALTITYSKTHYDLSKCAQGKSVVHLHNEAISKTAVSIPSLPEQRAIASYFTALDAQITLHRERLEKLKQIKAACLERMFA